MKIAMMANVIGRMVVIHPRHFQHPKLAPGHASSTDVDVPPIHPRAGSYSLPNQALVFGR